jgi:hypothetical protein
MTNTYYVTTKETKVSGNENKMLPKGIALDVVQANENTLTLSNGDWIDANDAALIDDGDVNAAGDVSIFIKEDKTDKTTMVLSSIGALGGLYYAFTKKKSFWGYVGFFVLGSIAGSLASKVVTSIKK